MHKGHALLVLAGLLVATVLTGCGRNTLAVVNGEKITKDEFYKKLEQMQVGNPPAPAGAVVLRQMIGEKVVEQMAKKREVEPTDAQIQRKVDFEKKGEGGLQAKLQARNISLEDYKKELYAQQALVNIATKGVKVTDEEVKEFYKQAKDTLYTRPEHVRIGVIICKGKEKIDKAREQITSGTDFSTVALNMSEDELTKGLGGEVRGAVVRNMPGVPKNIIDTAFSLKIRESSKPVQVKEGNGPAQWVIIKCLDKRPKLVYSFNEVKGQIREGIAFNKGQKQKSLDKLLAKAQEDAKIKINSDRYKALAGSKKAKKKTGDKKD
ncbi:MAG: peptidyl-prolyl cis-trans isomerase [Armatimonadetes bacterium]|nr:peptidyl-prolyl cis-trans isomerase [Armatimonadota bacterium]